jgi:hypothetical protein
MVDYFTIAVVGFMLMAAFIIAIRVISRGNLLMTLRGGVPLVDKAGTGKICELTDYEVNEVSGKARLRLNYFGSGIKQTGFWFDPELDFFPGLDKVRWEDYSGTITCYKDLETGQKDYRDDELKNLTHKFKLLVKANTIYKRAGIEVLNYFEKTKIESVQEKEAFKHGKALNAIKKLTSAGEEGIDRNDLKGLGLVDE